MKVKLAVIILTYNEEDNITQCLESVSNWADQIFVLDSFSTDRTCAIIKGLGCEVVQHKFDGYSQQRNWALENLPIKAEWVLFLDADEWVAEKLKKEISNLIENNPLENGFYLKFRLIWMGRWIKRGYYPTWILRLFRYGKGRCEDRSINEHFLVNGKVGYLKNDIIHEDRKGIGEWIQKHNDYATKEAQELVKKSPSGNTNIGPLGSQVEKKRWIKHNVYNRLPPLVRPSFYFFYRLILKGGFLDGKEAFIYHFLQGLWYPFLIDVKYLEFKHQAKKLSTDKLCVG